ncbi:GNAT family N-acetyltransferase [Algibacter amylolyticus]|uniref:GNAT family N-acetyltransferase n=1 Tax=Algibacter amylolyticus TaxID=1608400 RepID=A0A5M7BA74_9FLAO|nr:GNAT family N-acetyltransferase [Algibacter amylolyticus]KAA5825630.1 GNAT family N-acetyltransferase [Algibacter amylolyticus]MBB5268141.1 GNAT superfamily N-acetyltransferase [Algibacter amylolyticus]TSJ79928.1 GNAT family N-acetyltransferase [Algibacter amylolyticus]
MITLKEVKNKKELKAFVKFPFKLYKDSEFWVPPIISQEIKTFSKKENPVFDDAEAQLFLAYKNGVIVGRIAAIVNWLEIKEQKIKKMRFGWFDFIDDQDVSKTLLNEVEKIGKTYNLEYTEGPVGFSNLDKVGVMTEGFDSIAPMVTWYNHAYYAKHYRDAGYEVEKSYSESKFPFENVKPEFFKKAQELIKRRYQLKALKLTTTEEVMPYADKMFDLFNESYASLSSFVAINEVQKAYFKKKFISFINPEYIKFVVDKDDKMIGFAIVMPAFAKALQKMNGKLFPFGFRHILNAKKNSKDVIFYLIGIHPDYQNKGVHAVIFNEYYETFKAKGIETCYRTPELEDNEAIHKIWKHFSPEVYKRRKTFRKNLA